MIKDCVKIVSNAKFARIYVDVLGDIKTIQSFISERIELNDESRYFISEIVNNPNDLKHLHFYTSEPWLREDDANTVILNKEILKKSIIRIHYYAKDV